MVRTVYETVAGSIFLPKHAHSRGLLNEIASSNDAMANRSPIGIGSAVHKVVRLLANVGDTDWLESQV